MPNRRMEVMMRMVSAIADPEYPAHFHSREIFLYCHIQETATRDFAGLFLEWLDRSGSLWSLHFLEIPLVLYR
jgi:hypothetical protein